MRETEMKNIGSQTEALEVSVSKSTTDGRENSWHRRQDKRNEKRMLNLKKKKKN